MPEVSLGSKSGSGCALESCSGRFAGATAFLLILNGRGGLDSGSGKLELSVIAAARLCIAVDFVC